MCHFSPPLLASRWHDEWLADKLMNPTIVRGKLMRNIALLLRLLFLALIPFYSEEALGVDNLEKPHQIIEELKDEMYAIGETSPSLAKFNAAVQQRREQIRNYIVMGDPRSLTEKNSRGMTPLIAAAYSGYNGIAEELLSAPDVVGHINEIDATGISAWTYANFALKQTGVVCNPSISQNPFMLIPLLVQVPYYWAETEMPYPKTRRILEIAGATIDMATAKQLWIKTCKVADQATKEKVMASKDLQKILTEEARIQLKNFIKDEQH